MAPVHMTTAPAVPFHSSNWSKDGKKQGHHNKIPFSFPFLRSYNAILAMLG
jgi:hypothetical protein